ncbi:MAG: hypothetical protein HY291_13025 [Planctomycetes bacterium]|nr:hypothetical protein [Planctomycetota bacterium]
MRATFMLTVALCAAAAFASEDAGFKPMGLGGGGGLFTPVGSPHDTKLLLVSCDMGGFYRSTDGGQHWTMLDGRIISGNTRCLPVFDLKDAKRVYFASHGKILTSTDAGETWSPTSESVHWKGEVQELAADPGGGALLLAGYDKGAFKSDDRGKTWQACEGLAGKIAGLFIDPNSPSDKRVVLAGSSEGVFRSEDGGKTFAASGEGLPGKNAERLCGGAGKDGARAYALVQGKLFKSADLGKKWEAAEAKGLPGKLRFMAMAKTDAKTLYITDTDGRWGVYKSEDEGQTFANVFRGFANDTNKNVEWGWLAFDAGYGWGGPAIGFSVNAGHPEQSFYTNSGELYGTNDGGTQWKQLFSHCEDPAPGKDKRWSSIGLEVTTTWQFTIDPFDPQKMFICYTDIGFARSSDGGKSWQHSVSGSPWGNTFYQLVPDPKQDGLFYAVAANQHDIPGWTQVDGAHGGGGVLVSTDHCATWKPLSKGFPEKKPCRGIAVDLKSPVDKRVIYAAVYGEGVLKTSDGGATWAKKSAGVGHGENPHVSSLYLAEDGALYCLVTGKRKDIDFDPPGGLWVSRDGAETWTELTKGQTIWWPTEFAVDPKDPKTILLAAADVPKKSPATGGLWKTSDGGATWTHILNQKAFNPALCGFVHSYQPMFDPENSQRVYFANWTHGLLISDDGAKTFREFKDVPFISTNRVTLDPKTGTLYVCTFGGGVWKGKIPPAAK